MDQGFPIFMLIFAAALLLYAALLAVTRDELLLPMKVSVSIKSMNKKEKKEYALRLAKMVALVAAAPAVGGLIGLWNQLAGAIVMGIGFVVTLWLCTKIAK